MKGVFNASVFMGRPLYPADITTTVSVYNAETDELVPTLWLDRDGADELANPHPLSEDGVILFYADPGRYNIVVEKGTQLYREWPDVIISDSATSGTPGIQSVVAGTNVTVDDTDPLNPVVSATGSSSNSTSVLSLDKPGGTLDSQKTEYDTLLRGGTLEIVNIPSGPGYISSLFIACQFITGSSVTAYADGMLRIYYDGELTPSVEVRMATFFQFQYATTGGRHANEFFGFNFTSDGSAGSWFCNLPMPYSNGIRIEITNGSANTDLRVWSVATIHGDVPNTWSRTRRLMAEPFYVAAAPPNSLQTFVDTGVTAPGRLMGIWMLADGFPGSVSVASAFLEGNISIYLDGNASPSYESSGNEDYFLLGFYGASVPIYSWSGQAGTTFRNGNVTTSFYRLHVRDPITFESGLEITWRCGDTSQVSYTGNTRAWACTYYYTE